MPHLTQTEFNTIRELLGPAFTGKAKYGTYAEQAKAPQIKRIFQDMANSCNQKANTLMGLL